MEDERRALDAFLKLHAKKIRRHERSKRTAFLVHYSDAIPLDVKFEAYDIAAVTRELDGRNGTVQWLLKQMHTYDPSVSNVVGLIFPNGNVLAHVILFGAPRVDDD